MVITEAYKAGWVVGSQGGSFHENPHTVGTEEARHWNYGHLDGKQRRPYRQVPDQIDVEAAVRALKERGIRPTMTAAQLHELTRGE